MKLKPQPPLPRRAPRRACAARARGGARPRGRGARRPGVPMRRRVSTRLPSIRRILAGVGAAAAVAVLVALLNGPWLRVTQVTWAGERWAGAAELQSVLDPAYGQSLLAVDTASLRARLERIPAVAEATVTAGLDGSVAATVVERDAAFVWHAHSTRFLGSVDGTIFAAIDENEPLAPEIGLLPSITDERFVARLVSVGDVIPDGVLATALQLVATDPVALGSTAARLSVRIDDEFGFRLTSSDPAWEVALGVYGLDPNETLVEAAARLERQVTAVRTLFATEPEAGIGWVDVRNPGKVYFRAKG
jgi:POTRA domain, FtsQ-type